MTEGETNNRRGSEYIMFNRRSNYQYVKVNTLIIKHFFESIYITSDIKASSDKFTKKDINDYSHNPYFGTL